MYLLRQTKHLRSIRTKCSIEPMIRSLSQSDSLGARFTQIKRLFTRRGLGRLSHLSWIFTVYHVTRVGKLDHCMVISPMTLLFPFASEYVH